VDAIEVLKHDHRMVEQLFIDYQATGGAGEGAASGSAGAKQQRRGVVEVLIRELSKHAALEELIFYPFAKKLLPDGEEEIDRHLSEHMTVKRLLTDLDHLNEGDEEEEGLMAALEKETKEHIREEEEDLMVQVKDAADQEALDDLGKLIDEGKSAAPTRAHPRAPDEPPALALAGPIASIYDRLRDRLQGRPQT
jgi:hemerythrin-like domain-containing protein